MHKAQVSAETEHFVHCPNCGARSGRIDHMAVGHWRGLETSWSCDECGSRYRLRVDALDDVYVAIANDRGVNVPCLHLLKLSPQTTPVYVVIKSRDYGRGGKDNVGPFSGTDYFYNEYTCPTNWTDQVEKFVRDGDDDPHGLFEYVTSVDLPEGKADPADLDEFIRSAFPDIFRDDDE